MQITILQSLTGVIHSKKKRRSLRWAGGHEATEKANRIQAWQHLSDWQLVDRFERDRPVLLWSGSWWSGQHELEVESAGWWQNPTRRARCKQCAQRRVVKKFSTQTLIRCNWVEVANAKRAKEGVEWQSKNHSSHWSAWFSPIQIRDMLADSTTSKSATPLWRWRELENWPLSMRIGGRVNMVVAHIGANELSLETDRWGVLGARGESRGIRQQPKGTWPPSCISLGACDHSLYFGWLGTDDSEHRECCNNKFEQALTLLHSAKSSTKIKYSKQGNTQSIFYSL